MATDVNTRLQNISTDVSAISNLVNRLVTIYSAGGVQNPDLANLKAELQAWTNTQLGGYATIDSPYFTNSVQLRSGNLTIMDIDQVAGDGVVLRDCEITKRDKNGQLVSAIIFSNTNSNNGNPNSIYFRCYTNLVNAANIGNYANFNFTAHPSSDGNSNYYALIIPTPEIKSGYNSVNGLDAINRAFLENTGNGVVHKYGDETILGNKEFKNPIVSGTFTMHYGTKDYSMNYTPIDAGRDIVFVDEQQVFGSIVSRVWNTGNVALTLYANGFKTSADETHEPATVQIANLGDGTRYIRIGADTLYTPDVVPDSDNTRTLGLANTAYAHIYATNGTVEVSDERLKDEISDIPEAVFRAWGKVKFQQFKMKDSVAKKGSASARIHMGVVAQRIKEAFQSEGLDAARYGLFCYDEWEDQYEDEQVLVTPERKGMVKVVDKQPSYVSMIDDNGNITNVEKEPEQYHMEEQVVEEAVYRTEKKLVQPAGNKYSVRYEECLALECAYQRWVLKKIADKVGVAL